MSSQQTNPTQRALDHIIDRLIGHQARKTQTAPTCGALDFLGPAGECSAVCALRAWRRRELALDPSLGVLQARIAGPVQRDFLRGEELQHGAVLARELKGRNRRLNRRLTQAVRDEHGHSRTLPADWPNQPRVIGGTADWKRLNPGEQL